MAEQNFSNSIYSGTKPEHYEDSVYSGPHRARSVVSAKTGHSVYSNVTKKSSDFYRTEGSSYVKKQTTAQRLLRFVWNPEEHTVLGRTWDRWLKLLALHAIMYLVLVAVWAACFALFDFFVLNEDQPVLKGDASGLRLQPSLSFYPQPDHYTTLIRFRTSRLATVRKYVDDLVAVTQWYEDHGLQNVLSTNEIVKDCTKDSKNTDPLHTVCRFNLDVGRGCNAYKNFGFADGEPCILLKLNRVFGWMPDPITSEAVNTTGVMVQCRGRTPTDDDFIGHICYHYSSDGGGSDVDYCFKEFGVFEHYFFPYLRQIRYMSPLVFVEFKNMARNVVIMIECEARAKNILVDKTYRIGTVQFEFLID